MTPRPSTRLGGALSGGLLVLCAASSHAEDAGKPGRAEPPDAGDAGAQETDASTALPGATSATCTERLPEGKTRPKVTEAFPAKTYSGHAASLEIKVEHGKGETVLPTGFQLQPSSPEHRALQRAGFRLPHPDGGGAPSVERTEKEGADTITTVRIPFLVLPEKPGRQELTLPPLPIAIARASGDVIALCTEPHTLTVEDPIADTPNPVPRENLEGRRQLEEWTAAKHVTIAALIALLVGAVLAWLIGKWRSRPKPVVPPPPPRPPWEVAFEALARIRGASLIREQRFGEHFDQVSDVIRKYLGDQYGFDGLESTTRETLTALRRPTPPIPALREIEAFLREADLVKFARITPAAEDCERALERGEGIVRATMAPPVEAPAVVPGPVVSEPSEGGAA